MTIPVWKWKDLDPERQRIILRRSEEDLQRHVEVAREVVEAVRLRGDEAIREFNRRFDGVDPALPLRLTEEEIERSISGLDQAVREALDAVIHNVIQYHRIQIPPHMNFTEVIPGVLAGERFTPIDSVGLYVPRGKGSFPSMVYMLAVPATLAGVKRIALVSPPSTEGSLDAACLYAARQCGVTEIYRVGGAQAIAALAYGTESLPRVDKIVGPASAFVSAAKRLVAAVVDVGLPAGPSESVILADETADAHNLALDLLNEAEHGPDSSAILATDSESLAHAVAERAAGLVLTTPSPRREYLIESFRSYSALLVFSSLEEAAEWVNDFAPEHLSIQTREPFALLSRIRHAGEILLGPNLPFSLANYATGPNAVLPTGGKARTWGPVSVRDFMKSSSIVTVTRNGFKALATHVATLARYEGFPSHERAVRERKA